MRLARAHPPTSLSFAPRSDLAVHIDGFIAPVAKTFVVGGGEITGRKADVMAAANLAAEVALRMCRPGNKVRIPLPPSSTPRPGVFCPDCAGRAYETLG